MLIDPTIWSAVIREEHQASVVTLRRVSQQIEGGIVVEQEVLGVAGLRANDIRSLDGIATEEDWEIESDNVIIPFASV